MATKYRLLKDLPGIPAGMIIDAQAQPIEHFAPVLSLADREWFEPVEDFWKPAYGQSYWWLNSCLVVDVKPYREAMADVSRISARNCFRTEALAELAAEKVRQCFMQFQKEHRDA